MVNVPSVPEVITVNSETLQSQIRDLLPSQNGFGSELQATNVITPIIDLTSAAEGASLPVDLQTAASFGSQTEFQVTGATTVTLTSNPGFYKIIGVATAQNSSGLQAASFDMDDGSTTKKIYELDFPSAGSGSVAFQIDLIVFVAAGITLSATSSGGNSTLSGSFRQIADSSGTLVNPVGF